MNPSVMIPAPRHGNAWIAIVAAFLIAGVTASVTLAVVAGRADTRRVLPDYYPTPPQYAAHQAEIARSNSLGWRSEISSNRQRVQVQLRDRNNSPVTDASVHLVGFQRAHADQLVTLNLEQSSRGTYAAPWPAPTQLGLYDFRLRAQQGTSVFEQQIQLEVIP